jgi:hypothetical protein
MEQQIFRLFFSRRSPVRASRIALALLAIGLFVVGGIYPAKQPAIAAAGINSTLNFQGRLLTVGGAVVADGVYNLEFKIYQDGTGCVSGGSSPCSGTLKWTEDRVYGTGSPDNRVTIRNGYFSVALGSVSAFGSSVDWNQDTLWLSINVGDTSTAANFAAASGDGEMLPMKRLSSSVYALNAGQLGGLSSAQYLQLAQGVQTDSSTTQPSIGINKTAGSQNLITLQSSGTDVFDVTSTGNLLFGNNADKTISITTSAAATAGRALTLQAGTGGSGSGSAGGGLVLQGGDGGGTNANGGGITLSPGVKTGTGTAGVVIIKPNSASSTYNSTSFFQVQNHSGTAILTVDTVNSRVAVAGNTTITGTASGDLVVKSHTNGGGNLVFDGQRNNGTSMVRLTDDGEIALGSSSSSLPGRISVADSSGNYGIFQTVSNLGSTRTYTLPGSTGTVCLDANNCSAIMQLQDAYDNGTSGSTTPEIKLTTGGSLNGFDIQDADSTMGTGQNFLSLRASSVGALGNVVVGFGIGGDLYMQPTANSNTLIDVNTQGGGNLLTVDSSNQRVGINLGSTTLPAYTLDVTGDINTSTNIRTGGTIRLDNAGALSNVTASTAILTSGTLGVARGGTGVASTTAYGLLFGGTTSTSAFQSLGTGNSGEILQSNGAGALPSWVGGAGCSTCIAQVPTTTLQNTITPATSGVVSLTVNANATGTIAQAVIVNQSAAYAGATMEVNHTNTSGTINNGILVNRNGASGTTTNGINITQTAGTLTNGLAFTGTIGTDITRGSGTLTLQGTGGVTITAGTTNAVTIDSAGAGSVLVGSTNASTITLGTTASTGTITVGRSTDSNTINIGNAQTATAKTQTISIGTAATGTGKAAITIGNTNDASSLTLQAGTGNVNLLTNASTAGVIAKSNTNSATAFVVQNSSSVALFTADTSATKVTVAGDLVIDKRTDSGGTTSDWAVAAGASGAPCASAATSVDGVKTSVVYNGSLYIGTSEADKAEVCRYDGGTTFTRMNSAAGTFGSATSTDTVGAMTVYNGYLYIGTTGGGAGADANKASMYRWDGSTTFTLVNTTQGTFDTNGAPTIDALTSMVVYRGSLYIGISEANKAQVQKYNGGTGASVFSILNPAGTIGAVGTEDTVSAMTVYNDTLYVGITEADKAQVFTWSGGLGFDDFAALSNSGDFNGETAGDLEDEVSAMVVYNGSLLVAVSSGTNSKARVYRHNGGGNYEQLNATAGTFGSQTGVDYVKSMAVYGGSLYVGTQESNIGGVYRYDPSAGTFGLTNTAAGQLVTTTAIDGVTTMMPFNDKLFVGTTETDKGEVYSYSMVEGQSRALYFNAPSDNAGSTEQSGFPNQASIFFAAEQNGTSNLQGTTGSFIFSHGINTSTGAYDVAEDYPTRDDTLRPGDLVSIDPNERGFVRKATGPYDSGLVGVYSERPALRLSQQDTTINGGRAIPVALAGRVPVRVSTANGPILPGDPLASSSVPGVAMKATGPGRIVGMAMEGYSGSDEGTVTTFVNPNYYSGLPDLQSSASMGNAVITGTLTTKDLVVTNKAVIKSLDVTNTATVGSLTVMGAATAQSLAVADSIVTKDLAVSGNTSLVDVTVSGHITTRGATPTASALPGAGKDAQVSVSGNDVSGTITIKAGQEAVAGSQVKLVFAKPYGKAPHVVISPNGSKAAALQVFLDNYSPTEFSVGVNTTPTEGQEYKYEYFVTQDE